MGPKTGQINRQKMIGILRHPKLVDKTHVDSRTAQIGR